MATRILVTGATGFVGSHVLEQLADWPGVEVVAACRDPARLLPSFNGAVRVGDLRDPGYRAALLDDIDAVCHCATWSSLWGHAAEVKRLYEAPTLALLDEAVAHRIKRFLHVSTTSAAAPGHSAEARSQGIRRRFWPHLNAVIAIEEAMRARAGATTMVNLRLGIFAGRRYGLGVLPILLPRLRTHLVPWVAGGRTSMPLTDGRDIGQAFARAATVDGLTGYEAFNIVGPTVPTVHEVIDFLHDEFGYSPPHFSVPFAVAYPFAWLMEKLDPLVPWEPLVVRSVIHLMEEVGVDNRVAEERLGYRPQHDWRNAIRDQVAEMADRQRRPISMAKAIS